MMDTVADFRVVRDGTGVAGFKDDRTWRMRDGKAVPAGQTFIPPYLLNDAFGPATKTMNGINYTYEGTYRGCRLFKADVVIKDAQGM